MQGLHFDDAIGARGVPLAVDVHGTDSLRDDQTGDVRLFARADMRLRIRPLPMKVRRPAVTQRPVS